MVNSWLPPLIKTLQQIESFFWAASIQFESHDLHSSEVQKRFSCLLDCFLSEEFRKSSLPWNHLCVSFIAQRILSIINLLLPLAESMRVWFNGFYRYTCKKKRECGTQTYIITMDTPCRRYWNDSKKFESHTRIHYEKDKNRNSKASSLFPHSTSLYEKSKRLRQINENSPLQAFRVQAWIDDPHCQFLG